MKTLLKLIFIGVIIGVTVNFLDGKNVDVKGKAFQLFELAKQKLSNLEFSIPEELNRDNIINESEVPPPPAEHPVQTEKMVVAPLHSPENHRASHQDKSVAQIDLTDTPVRSIEMPVRNKPGQNNNRFNELDKYAGSVPESLERDFDLLVEYLVKPAKNNLEQTRLLFSWIAQNIFYDDHGYNTGYYGDLSARGVFQSRVAVCQGFSELFKVMGEKAGLDIILVTGYAKGISYRSGQSFRDTNHAWNLVYIDNKWRLFDVTWAQGYGTAVNGKLVSIKKFDNYWFDTPPDEFIFSHLPENQRWQLTTIPISLNQYEKLPYAGASYFKLGFDGTSCLQQACEGSLNAFPESYLNDGSVRVLSLPGKKEIEAHQPITIRLRSERSADIAVINNGEWVHLRKDGNEYMAVINPQPGVLKLSARIDRQSGSYNTLLKYSVN